MSDTMALALALACAVLALPCLFLVAWGTAGGDGEPANPVAGVLAWLTALGAFASVAAGIRQLTVAPSPIGVAVMATAPALALLALLASGPRAWRADPASRVTREDVRAMGLDPDEFDLEEDGASPWTVIFWIVAVVTPIAAPLLALSALPAS